MLGLDPHSIRLVKDLLKREVAAGMCVLMSTHTLTAAEEISSRVGIMNHGKPGIRRYARDVCASDFRRRSNRWKRCICRLRKKMAKHPKGQVKKISRKGAKGQKGPIEGPQVQCMIFLNRRKQRQQRSIHFPFTLFPHFNSFVSAVLWIDLYFAHLRETQYFGQ